MLTNNNFHLTYCTNIHPAESWDDVFNLLKKNVPAVKNSISPEAPFGIGLYLSNRASEEILQNDQLELFKNWLRKNALYVFTINGFPYGNFYEKIVKQNVYLPDWISAERTAYTKRLFSVLAEIIPANIDGGVSTVPLFYKTRFQNNTDKAIEAAIENLANVAFFLSELSEQKGNYFHLDLEPEPDCFLENCEDVINFFSQKLIPLGANFLKKEKNISLEKAEEVLRRHICICYDICHFAVEFEEQKNVLQKFAQEKINIGKIQISSAVKAIFDGTNDKQKITQLQKFHEPRYLHQTVIKKKSGELEKFDDLSDAVFQKTPTGELRTHYHVPLFLENFENLQTTQNDVLEVLEILKKNHIANHLEVETYTWDVLPENLRSDLTANIIRELQWVKKNLE